MPTTIYLRDGNPLVILETHTITTELLVTDSGFRHALVCRDRRGQIVATFDRESVLAYRGKRQTNRQIVGTDVGQTEATRPRAELGVG